MLNSFSFERSIRFAGLCFLALTILTCGKGSLANNGKSGKDDISNSDGANVTQATPDVVNSATAPFSNPSQAFNPSSVANLKNATDYAGAAQRKLLKDVLSGEYDTSKLIPFLLQQRARLNSVNPNQKQGATTESASANKQNPGPKIPAPSLPTSQSAAKTNDIPPDISKIIADQIRESGRVPTEAYIQAVFSKLQEARIDQPQPQALEAVVDLRHPFADLGQSNTPKRGINSLSELPSAISQEPNKSALSKEAALVLKAAPVAHLQDLLGRYENNIGPEKLQELTDAFQIAQQKMDPDQLNQILDGAFDEAKGDAETFTEIVAKQLQSRFPEMALNSFTQKDSSPADPLLPSKPIAKGESLLARDSSHSSQNSLQVTPSSRNSHGPNKKPNYFLYLGLSLCFIVMFWGIGRHLQVGAVFAAGPVLAGHSPQSPPKNQDDVILEIENRSVPDGKTQETITAVQFRMSNFEIRYSKLDRRYDIRGTINKKEIDGCLMAGSIVDARYIPGILDYSGNLMLTPQGGWVKTSEPKQRFAISPRSIMRPAFRNSP